MIDRFSLAPRRTLGAGVIFTLLWSFPLLAENSQDSTPDASSESAAATSLSQVPASSVPAGQTASPVSGEGGTNAGIRGSADLPPAQQNTPQTPQNDRLLFALPNYMTVENAKKLPPLTAGEKFKLVAKGTFDRAEYPFIGTEALVAQLDHDDEQSLRQGLPGYAKRYALAFGDTTVGNFMTGAVVPSVLHQDPRYYQLGTGGFFHRALYAAGRVFIIRSDSGHNQFNASEILGNALAGGISNFYHPRGDRKLAGNIEVWYTQTAWDWVGFELKEFWPDLRRLLHKKN